MNDATRRQALEERVASCQDSVGTFMRIHEELIVLRGLSAIGVARERMDAMIRLNQETMDVIKRSLAIAEGELARAIRVDPGEMI